MSDDKARALERVRKMLALANDAAASEGERDNAIRMAHATLAKYNLTLAQAEKKKDDRGEGTLETRDRPWRRTVCGSIARLFFCEMFFVRHRRNYIKSYFVGREANVETARGISEYVIESIVKEATAFSKGEALLFSSFCKGAAHKLYYRCIELRNQAEAASRAEAVGSTGTSLVLASVYETEKSANQAWIAARHGMLTLGKNRERGVHGAAYQAGQEHGARVSLNRRVGTTKSATPRLK